MQRKAKSNKNQSNWSKATKGKEKQSKTKQIKAKQWNCSAKKAISIGSIDARTSFRKELRCSIWNLGHFFASIFVHETQDSRTAFFPLCQAIRTHPRSYPGHLAWQEKFLNFCHFMFLSFQCFRFKEANFAKFELWIYHCTNHTKTNKHIHIHFISLFKQLCWSFNPLKPSHPDEIPLENL